MRAFKHFNQTGEEVCPICQTKENKETVLIVKFGTQDGDIAEGIQVHLSCLDLIYDKELKIIYQKL
jgi:hypothetical protein